MKKIGFIPLIVMLLTASMAFAADEIHWTFTGPNSVAFDWRGPSTEKTIGYGLTSGVYMQVTATTPNPVPVSTRGSFWEANLTDLTANTLYYYKIGSEPEKTFRTPPVPGSSDFNVYALGNIGSSSTYFNTGAVQDIIANDRPAFVVGLGDLSLGSINGTATIDQHFNDVMAWSKEAAYMPVWGDLEWINSSADSFENYKGRFNVPNSQTSPVSPLAGGKDWYWFDYGNTRFITLPEPWSGAWSAWNTAAGDLMAQAQADPNIKFIVTFGHQPAYSSGHYSGLATLKGMLDTLGDTYSKYMLNINGHSNNYERSFPQHGVTHVTAGTGGANLTQDGTCLWLTCAQPDWSAFRAMHLGALKLHFTDLAIEGSFICGPAGGGTNDVNCAEGNVADIFTIAHSTATATNATATSAAALPDVIVTSLSYDNGVFTSTVKNQGTVATPAGVYVGVRYSVDGINQTWGSVNGPLAAGASVTIGTNGGTDTIPAGTHTIMAYVDDVNRFAESNQTNNQLFQSISVSGTAANSLIQGFAAVSGVTGGAGGRNIVVTNLNENGAGSLKAAITSSGTRTITFTPGLTGTINWTGVVYVDYPDMTIDGAGANITISGMSLSIFKSNTTPIHNIIIRNLTFAFNYQNRNSINIEYGTYNVWIDHNTFHDNSWNNDITGQGLNIWNTGGNNLPGWTGITVSWNHFKAPNAKSLLIGSESNTDVTNMRVSVHHNWFDNVYARNPRVHGKGILVHAWNNYIKSWSEYGMGVSQGSDLLAENNYFENTNAAYKVAINGQYATPTYPKSNSTNASGNFLGGNPTPTMLLIGTFPRYLLTYNAVLETANDTLKTRIMASAGAH